MRRSNFGSGRGGPLMTDHLQDLELELELLKRKRQLIQQQQSEMLYRNPVQPQQTYGQHVQAFENRYNEPQRRNFSNMYDAAPRDNRSFVPKRPAPWASQTQSSDRFDAPHTSFKKPRQAPNPPSGYFNARPNPPPLMAQSKPLKNVAPQNRRQPPFHNSAKNKQAAKPNQSNFKRRPVQNRQPTQNRPSVAPKAAPPNVSAPQKPYYGTPKEIPSVHETRKPVVLSDAVEPSHKVNGRLELALGTIVKQIKAAHSESAHLFNSHSLARLMKKGIRERVRAAMVGKVVGAVPAIVEEYRKVYPPSTDTDILELATIKTQKLNENAELAIELLEEGDPEQYFRKNMKRLLEVKLEEMFQKAEQNFTDENAISETEIFEHLPDIKKSHENVTFIKRADNNKPVGNQEAKEENQDAKEKSDEVTEKKDVLPKSEYEKWVSMLIARLLPKMLPKFKDYIIKLLDMDKMYCATKAAILINTNNNALILAKNKDMKPMSAQPSKDDPVLPKNLPYFVKVRPVPNAPKRKQFKDFLLTFNPRTIKRHKNNFNLLFVGFADKADYDRILQADQTKIGSSTIHIVGFHKNNKPSLFDNDNRNDADKNQNDGDVLTPQLDDQINDLLSSIRKADEEANGSNQCETEQNESVDNKAQNDVEIVDNNANNDVEILEESGNANAETELDNGHDSDIVEVVDGENADVVTVEDDEVAPLKGDEAKEAEATGTPAKGRAPATPSTIRTRRASRLAQNN